MERIDTIISKKTKSRLQNQNKQVQVRKNFIFDTNVILHDYKCMDNFEENDIYIPF